MDKQKVIDTLIHDFIVGSADFWAGHSVSGECGWAWCDIGDVYLLLKSSLDEHGIDYNYFETVVASGCLLPCRDTINYNDYC